MSDLWKKYKKYMAAAGISIIVLLALTAFYVRYDYQQYCKEAVPILEYHGIGSADGWMKELFLKKLLKRICNICMTMVIKWYQ